MTCPTCQLHAGLLMSDEFDAKHDDEGISGDSALLARDTMIDRCRTEVKGSSDASHVSEDNDGRRVLHAVTSILLVHEPARALTDIETAARYAGKSAYFALHLTRLTRDLQSGRQMDQDLIARLHEEADAYLSEGCPSWKGSTNPRPAVFKHAAG